MDAVDKIKKIYARLKDDPFLNDNYVVYRELLYSLNTNYNFEVSLLREITNQEIFHLVGDYLKDYFPKYYQAFLNTSINLYDCYLLCQYLNASEEDLLSDKYKDIKLTKLEAEDLLISLGRYDYIFDDIAIINNHTIGTCLTLIHEYTHRIHYQENKNINHSYYALYSEFLAYYNTFLFSEYLIEKGYNKLELKLAFQEKYLKIIEEIKIFKLMDSFYYQKQLSPLELLVVIDSLEKEIIPILDYPHILAFIVSKSKYEEFRERPLNLRVKDLAFLLKNDIDGVLLTKTFLNLQDKTLVKKIINNFNR